LIIGLKTVTSRLKTAVALSVAATLMALVVAAADMISARGIGTSISVPGRTSVVVSALTGCAKTSVGVVDSF
jgi:hypothetical protein